MLAGPPVWVLPCVTFVLGAVSKPAVPIHAGANVYGHGNAGMGRWRVSHLPWPVCP